MFKIFQKQIDGKKNKGRYLIIVAKGILFFIKNKRLFIY